MRAAIRMMLMVGIAMAAACHKQAQSDQNIVVDNGLMANADIEALPPDESSATPSNQLANGDDNPDVNTMSNNSD